MKQPYVSTLISQNFTSGEKALGRQNIDAVSSAEVENQIESHISSLDYEDSPVSNQFVTSVSETDGIVSISRRQPVITDVYGLEDELSRITRQVQSDWTETDEYLTSFIRNKPENLVQDSAYVHTDNNFTDEEKNKLAGIASGAEMNVIDSIEVNGTAQTVTNKTVDITVPTATSQLTNDSGFITSASIPKEIDYFTTASTFDEIKASVNAGHAPVLKVESSSSGVSYKLRLPLVYFETGTMSAKVARFSGTQGDKLYTYTLLAGSWSTETKTLPTVNDGTLTIKQNGQTVATFSANQSINTTANINVSQAPLKLLTWRVVTPSGNSNETVYIEDNYAYYIDMTSTPGLILDTNVTDHPVHTIIQMGAAGASGVSNCPTWTVSWNDEALSLHEIKFQCASTGTDVNYMIDVTIQKLWSESDQQYYTVARVFDMPVLLRRYIPQHYVDDSTVMQVGAYRNLV